MFDSKRTRENGFQSFSHWSFSGWQINAPLGRILMPVAALCGPDCETYLAPRDAARAGQLMAHSPALLNAALKILHNCHHAAWSLPPLENCADEVSYVLASALDGSAAQNATQAFDKLDHVSDWTLEDIPRWWTPMQHNGRCVIEDSFEGRTVAVTLASSYTAQMLAGEIEAEQTVSSDDAIAYARLLAAAPQLARALDAALKAGEDSPALTPDVVNGLMQAAAAAHADLAERYKDFAPRIRR